MSSTAFVPLLKALEALDPSSRDSLIVAGHRVLAEPNEIIGGSLITSAESLEVVATKARTTELSNSLSTNRRATTETSRGEDK